ncbi:MAG: hypothetical protein D4R97_06935 [Bacteroidetes bacterium]|nr:MAG: hypothetical protein D4R97_06935 [Bacteroidota bacterium]
MMRKYIWNAFLVLLMFSPLLVPAQEDLLNLLKDQKPPVNYAEAIFKTSRIVIGQSIENPAQGNMLFLVTHHFGALNTGYSNLFGLKQAAIRIGMEYGLSKRLAFGIGLNTDRNTWDGFLKYKVLRQKSGGKKFPFSLSLFANTAVYTTKWENPDRKNYLSSRMSYCIQVLIARKFGSRLSLQITPSMVHKNLVPISADHNDIFTLGGGGRMKISNRVSINAEYHHIFKGQVVSSKVYDSFSTGVDIETGGHVFQIFLTNSMGENEEGFLANTTGRWSKGDIFLGFNITRIFTIIKPKSFRE